MLFALAVLFAAGAVPASAQPPSAVEETVASQPGDQPRIVGSTQLTFPGSVICVCGYFPESALEGLRLGARPLGPPVSVERGVAQFQVPADVPPGDQVISGDPEAGFPAADVSVLTIIQVLAQIDQDQLWRGQSTHLRLAVIGTAETVELDLVNHTPGIVRLQGGDRQLVSVPGSGAPDARGRMPRPQWVSVGVGAVSRGEFNIQYTLTVPACPCEGLDPEITEPEIPEPEILEPDVTEPDVFVPEERDPTIPLPEEIPRREELVCSEIDRRTEAGPPIDLRVRPPTDAEAFPFPRPVPLQAVATDYDLVTFFCSGCEGGTSFLRLPVEDRVSHFTWRLLGEGRLNVPYGPMDDLETKRRRIEELKEQIREKAEELEAARDERDRAEATRDQRRAALEAQRGELMARRAEAEGELAEARAEQAEIESSLAEQEERIAEARAEIERLQEEIEGVEAEIRQLEERLANEPGPEEQAVARELEVLEERVEARGRELEALRETHAAQEEALRQAYLDAEAALATAEAALAGLQQAVAAKQEEIAALEAALRADPVLGPVLQAADRIARLVRQLGAQTGGAGRPDPLAGRRLGDLARDALAAPTEPERRSLLQSVLEEGSGLVSAARGGCLGMEPSPARDACLEAGADLARELEELESLLAERLEEGLSPLTRSRLAQLAALRGELAALDAQMRQAEGAAQAAEEAVVAAQEAYLAALARFDEAEREAVEAIRRLEEEAAALEARLADLVAERERHWLENAAAWRAEVAALRSRIIELEAAIGRQVRAIEAAQDERYRLERTYARLAERIVELERELAALASRLADLERGLAALEGEAAGFDQRIAELEDELRELEAQLQQLEREVAEGEEGYKSANGPIVYYIPPPLERILEMQGRMEEFDRHKQEVADREAELAAAQGEKGALQRRAFLILRGMTIELWALKEALERVEALEAEVRELESDRARLRSQLVLDQNERLRELQEEKARLEQEKQELEAALEEAQETRERTEEGLEQARSALDEAERVLESARQELELQRAGHARDRERRRQLGSRLEERKAAHERTVSELRDTEAELARVHRALSRAAAARDEEAESRLRAEAERLERQLEQLEARRASERAELDRMAVDLRLATVAEAESARSVEEAERAVREAERARVEARQAVKEAGSELAKARQIEQAAENELGRVSVEAEEAERALRETHEEIARGADEHEAVQEATEELEAKKKELEEAEAARDRARTALERLQLERDRWRADRDAADERIAEAKAELRRARQELRDFLVRELETVELEVRLRVTAANTDPPLDAFRSQDADADIVFTFQYPADRTPRFPAVTAAPGPPPREEQPAACVPQVAFEVAGSIAPEPPSPAGSPGPVEPQTVALFYREGEPLYPEWPQVVPTGEVLMRSAAPWVVAGGDTDELNAVCVPGGAETGEAVAVGVPTGETAVAAVCLAGPPTREPIADPVHFSWSGGGFFTGSDGEAVFLRVPDVPDGQCRSESELEVLYSDSKLQADDDEREKADYAHTAGLLSEVRPLVREFDREGRAELPARIFDGAHEGLPGESVRWTIEELEPEGAGGGFDGGASELLETTDPTGSAAVGIVFEEPYGRARVAVRWERDAGTCEEREIEVLRLIALELLAVVFAPRDGWKEAEELFEGEAADLEGLARRLPEEGPTPAIALGAGLRDDQRNPLDGKTLEFRVVTPGGLGLTAEAGTTRIVGIAWTLTDEVPDEEDVELAARVEEELEEWTEPPEVADRIQTATERRFRIGREGAYLLLETEEEFIPGGDPYSGAARLVLDASAFGVPHQFETLRLEANGIEVSGPGAEAEPPVAVAGAVSWTGSLAFAHRQFELTATEIGLTAGADGRLGGKIKVPRSEAEPSFLAVFGPAGFYGEAADFPEVELASFRLEKGAAVAVDFHQTEKPQGAPADWPGTGLLIRQARVVLPEAFRGSAPEPPAVAVKDLFISPAGIDGHVQLEYAITAALGKLEFTIREVELVLKNSRPTGGELAGSFVLPDPFVGSLAIAVGIAAGGEDFSLSVHTDDPVAMPRYGLVFDLQPGTGGSYSGGVFTFMLNAVLVSETFSDITIRGFQFDTDGNFQAEQIAIHDDIHFGRGFHAHLESFSFRKHGDDFQIGLACGFRFGGFLEAERVAVTVSSGPKIDAFEASVRGRRDPVSFSTDVTYAEDLFQGSVRVEVERLFAIDGTFVLGVQEATPEETFTFWYVELAVRTAIPLGNTGLNVIELGGGVGYNYDPPIGHASGAARHTSAFAFKAAMAVGNAPRGEVFAGRVTMVLVEGKFSINGKVWVLQREESLYGEGQLDIYWSPDSKLAGFVRMVTALPDTGGSILKFNGQVDFLFAGGDNWYIRSRELSGAILQRVKADGSIDIQPGRALLDGRIHFEHYSETELLVVTLLVDVSLEAGARLEFVVTETGATLDARARFDGHWDVSVDTWVGTFPVVAGGLGAELTLHARPALVRVEGSVSVSWSTWVHSGSADVELGYTYAT